MSFLFPLVTSEVMLKVSTFFIIIDFIGYPDLFACSLNYTV